MAMRRHARAARGGATAECMRLDPGGGRVAACPGALTCGPPRHPPAGLPHGRRSVVVRAEAEVKPLDVLRNENAVLKQTIADTKATISGLEGNLTRAGVDLPAQSASSGTAAALAGELQPEDFWSPAIQVQPRGSGVARHQRPAAGARNCWDQHPRQHLPPPAARPPHNQSPPPAAHPP